MTSNNEARDRLELLMAESIAEALHHLGRRDDAAGAAARDLLDARGPQSRTDPAAYLAGYVVFDLTHAAGVTAELPPEPKPCYSIPDSTYTPAPAEPGTLERMRLRVRHQAGDHDDTAAAGCPICRELMAV